MFVHACTHAMQQQRQGGLSTNSSFVEEVKAFFYSEELTQHLEKFAEQKVAEGEFKCADDVAFWICLFALDQHNPGDEVRCIPQISADFRRFR